jgi:hypothetical protein
MSLRLHSHLLTVFVQESCYAAIAPVTIHESSKNNMTLEMLQHRGQNF